MKNYGIYLGVIISGAFSYVSLEISKFNLIQLFFIGVFILIKIIFFGAVCGVVAKIISEQFFKCNKWIGKTKVLRRYM